MVFYVIRNDKGQFYSTMVDSEWGDGWTDNNPELFPTRVGVEQVLNTLKESEGANDAWVRTVIVAVD